MHRRLCVLHFCCVAFRYVCFTSNSSSYKEREKKRAKAHSQYLLLCVVMAVSVQTLIRAPGDTGRNMIFKASISYKTVRVCVFLCVLNICCRCCVSICPSGTICVRARDMLHPVMSRFRSFEGTEARQKNEIVALFYSSTECAAHDSTIAHVGTIAISGEERKKKRQDPCG